VAHHLLSPARSLEGGPDAVLEVFRRFGSIQFDPLAVAGRHHDLVLHARVAKYDPAWCELLYERREVFEAFNKGLALVPTEEFPWFRALRSKTAPRIPAEHTELAEQVLERIRAVGPLSVLDFERPSGEVQVREWGDVEHRARCPLGDTSTYVRRPARVEGFGDSAAHLCSRHCSGARNRPLSPTP
jgi:uncharacterized protein YcaQ